MRTYVGIDPSTEGRYYAVGLSEVGSVLSLPHGGLTAGMVSVHKTLSRLDNGLGEPSGLRVGVETPVYSYRAGAVGRGVLSCALVAGSVHGEAVRYGAEAVLAVAPEEWRKWLCGKRNPSDKEIKAALQRHVVLPRCNVHVRDALGVALWLRAVGRSALLPWLHWESASGWSSATPATGASSRTSKARKSGSAKLRKSS